MRFSGGPFKLSVLSFALPTIGAEQGVVRQKPP